MKKKIITITVLTLLHFGLTIVLSIMDLSAGMSRFDTGANPTMGNNVLHFVTTMLRWPIFEPLFKWGGRLASQLFSGILGYIPMLLNSLVWGILGWIIIDKVMKKRRAERF